MKQKIGSTLMLLPEDAAKLISLPLEIREKPAQEIINYVIDLLNAPFLHLRNKADGTLYLVCYTARLQRMKRMHGRLKKILQPLDYRMHKLIISNPDIEDFYNYLPGSTSRPTGNPSPVNLESLCGNQTQVCCLVGLRSHLTSFILHFFPQVLISTSSLWTLQR